MTWHHSLIHVFHSTWNLHKGFPIEWQKFEDKCKSDVFYYFLYNPRRSINWTKYHVDKYCIQLIRKFCSCSRLVENILFLRYGSLYVKISRYLVISSCHQKITAYHIHFYVHAYHPMCLQKTINPNYPLCPD